jgi:CheY-like chemotaxis protein
MLNKKFRVLLIEDDAVLRRGLALFFYRNQAEVTQLADGRQAVNFINNQQHDLIICDLRVPGIDGLRILKHLRGIGQATPFILMSAYYSEELERSAVAFGATAVFEKPIVLQDLIRQCEVCLNNPLQWA